MITRGATFPLHTVRDNSTETRSRIDVLTAELSSGRRADIGRAVSSDFSSISRIAHDLRANAAKNEAIGRAASWLQSAQTSLETVGQAGRRITAQLPAALAPATPDSVRNLAAVGRGALEDMAVALNAAQGGRSIFANGASGEGVPLDVGTIVSETNAIAQSATDLGNFLTAIDEYFAPPAGAGIEANAIVPYATETTSFPLGDGNALAMPVSLADPGIRGALKQAAIVAALPQLGFTMDAAERTRLASELPARGAQMASAVVTTQGRLGTVEERLSDLANRIDAETTVLEGRRTDAVGADPFRTATELQNEMTRLETIFAVTARRSRLRLTDFIR